MNLGIKLALSTALKTGGSISPPAWTPSNLFSNEEQGVLYMPWVSGTVWQNTAGTVPATDGDPVGRVNDLSGNGHNALQGTGSARPTLLVDEDIHSLVVDGVDDFLQVNIPANLTPNWTMITVAGRGSNTAVNTHTRLRTGSNNHIVLRTQTQERAQALSMGSSESIPQITFGLSDVGAFPENGYVISTLIVPEEDEPTIHRINGVQGSAANSNWPADTDLGSPIEMLLPVSPVAFSGGGYRALLVIDRALTPEEITQVEDYFAQYTGIIL